MPSAFTSPTGARLLPTRVPDGADAVVLVLHGGASREAGALVSPAQLSVVRMVPVARRLARSGRPRTAVYRVLNSRRGWDTTHTPVADATWAADAARQRLGDVPVALVGHSLGGRAALLAGAMDSVKAVVALNPWVYPDDDVDLTGRRVLVVHGTQDRVALPERSARVARRLAERADVRFVEVDGGRHAMLRHGPAFERLASDFVNDTFDALPSG